MIQKGISLILMLSLLLCLCACVNNDSDQPLTTDDPLTSHIDAVDAPDDVQQFNIPEENLSAGSVQLYAVPSTTGNGYYTGNKVLKYTDVDTKQTVVLCAQSGCDHSDASCQAWIGEQVETICVYRDVLYATIIEDGGAYVFLKKDIATGERTIIDTWDQEDLSNVTLGRFADMKCDVLVSVNITLETEAGEVFMTSETNQIIYDLATGEKYELPKDYYGWSIGAICGDRLLLTFNGPYYAYTLETIYGEDYQAHYKPSKMVEYNMTTGESKTIATEAEGLLFTGDPATTYGYLYVYQMGDDFCIYDLESSTSRVITTMENVTNFWILDHKLFLIEKLIDGESSKIYIYYMDIDGGDLIRMENNGNTDVMYFGVSWEGNGYFVGTRGGNKVIRKEDFYAENYTKDWGGGY